MLSVVPDARRAASSALSHRPGEFSVGMRAEMVFAHLRRDALARLSICQPQSKDLHGLQASASARVITPEAMRVQPIAWKVCWTEMFQQKSDTHSPPERGPYTVGEHMIGHGGVVTRRLRRVSPIGRWDPQCSMCRLFHFTVMCSAPFC